MLIEQTLSPVIELDYEISSLSYLLVSLLIHFCSLHSTKYKYQLHYITLQTFRHNIAC
jgi:hypothetical protein